MAISAICSCNKPSVTYDFNKTLEHHLISSGDNRPDFNPYADSVDHFIYALHQGITPNQFATLAGWSNEIFNSKLSLLKEKNFIWNNIQNEVKPRLMVITPSDAKPMVDIARKIGTQIADSIQLYLPSILKKYNDLVFSQTVSFKGFSFFLLSNVLLDNFQIDRVEKDYLNAPRTPRHGKNYYYQLAEGTSDSVEVFGIYGNQYWCNDTICVGVYGNRRKNVDLPSHLKQPLPLISATEYKFLTDMASAFEPSLISILKSNDKYFREQWMVSVYEDEVSYEEYFIWLYHFIYTEATNELASRNTIEIPKSGNFFYEANY
jgi:hypothetical protein